MFIYDNQCGTKNKMKMIVTVFGFMNSKKFMKIADKKIKVTVK